MRRPVIAAWTVAGLVTAAAAGAYFAVSASLPRESGQASIPSLGAPVNVELDAKAIPRIRATTIEDAFRAQGFIHAQQRFFQMDLMRRSAAGTLNRLFGARAAPADREQLVLRLAERADAAFAELPARHRVWLDAYADGVNAGLDDLGARPPEYWLIGQEPERWQPVDSLLVTYSLVTTLSINDRIELSQAVAAATLPAEVYAFLTPSTARFDRPLATDRDDPTGGYRALPLPGPDAVDLRNRPGGARDGVVENPFFGGASNQWAVAAERSADGRALLANDPHLQLTLPATFFRAELFFGDRVVRGASLPGMPGIIIGATGDIAWGATVSNADQTDWVVVEIDPNDPEAYLTPDGAEPFRIETATLDATGETIEILETRWGPIIAADGLGRPLALRATWLDAGGLNLDLLELAFAANVDEAVATIAAWSGPSMSWAVADSAGDIAWTLNGPLPERNGFDGSVPTSWRDGNRYWSGTQLPPAVRGVQQLHNANNRPLPVPDADALSRIWNRSYRAERIDRLLGTESQFDESDFASMQLDTDTRAVYAPIQQIILDSVASTEADAALAAARRLAAEWNGHADRNSRAFLLLDRYHDTLLDAVLAPLLEPALAADPRFVYRWPLADETLLRVLEERPAHLLPAPYEDWREFLRDALAATIDRIERERRLAVDTPWGEVNRLDVAHPLAGLPLLGRLLDLPAVEQDGAPVAVRVAGPRYGAALRLVVSPAAPEQGILQMPGGQSGHFLSPNFADQQADWVAGNPAPFLAGPAVAEFVLTPSEDRRAR
ncbi:MAG: penicillin acylase family protein [Gammaproteobacteria bacterium]|nr:penicillin acylase family protein [Gammaproteobacteria bacterium]